VRVEKSSQPGIAIKFEKLVILPEPWDAQSTGRPTK
jgi:hypothetical protein